jgi:hypothetical protein
MTQRDRDRLVALKKAKKGVITQRQAAEEIGQTERHVRRLLKQMKANGDRAIAHALRGRRSNRKLDEKVRRTAVEILGRKVYAASDQLWQRSIWAKNTALLRGARRCGAG